MQRVGPQQFFEFLGTSTLTSLKYLNLFKSYYMRNMQRVGFEPTKALSHRILSPAPLTTREPLLINT